MGSKHDSESVEEKGLIEDLWLISFLRKCRKENEFLFCLLFVIGGLSIFPIFAYLMNNFKVFEVLITTLSLMALGICSVLSPFCAYILYNDKA